MKILLWVTFLQAILLYFIPLLLGDIFMPNEYSWGIKHIIFYFTFPYLFLIISYFGLFFYYSLVVCGCIKIKQKFLIEKLKILLEKCSIKIQKRRKQTFLKSSSFFLPFSLSLYSPETIFFLNPISFLPFSLCFERVFPQSLPARNKFSITKY